jgi:hypothetical protein
MAEEETKKLRFMGQGSDEDSKKSESLDSSDNDSEEEFDTHLDLGDDQMKEVLAKLKMN